MAYSARKNRVTGEIANGHSLDYLFRPLILVDGEPVRYWECEITYQIPGMFFDGFDFLKQDSAVRFKLPTVKPLYRTHLLLDELTVWSCRRSGRKMIQLFTKEEE